MSGFPEVREFAGHSDIRTTELYFVRKEEDAEVAARKIQSDGTSRPVRGIDHRKPRGEPPRGHRKHRDWRTPP